MDIGYLADHKEAIPIIAEWFHNEWSYLYPDRSLQDIHRSIAERINRDRIPLALVAAEGNEILGTICLKVHDMDTRTDLSPWLAGLYVAQTHRRQGLGTLLVRQIEETAARLGIPRLYLYTPKSESFYIKARLAPDG